MSTSPKHDLKYLPVDSLVPNSWNPQTQDDAVFERLVAEITEVGFIDPIEVVSLDDGRFRILGGEHRWQAAKKAGLDEVPCIVIQGAKWNEVDLQKFVTVRLNTLRGQLDPDKFLKLYEEMADKYGKESLQRLMGYTDSAKWAKFIDTLTKDMKKGLPKEMQKEFESKAKEAKSVQDLERIIQELFAKHGDTMDLSFIIFTYGKQDHIYVQMTRAMKKSMDKVAEYCRLTSQDINVVMEPVVKQFLDSIQVKLTEVKAAAASHKSEVEVIFEKDT